MKQSEKSIPQKKYLRFEIDQGLPEIDKQILDLGRLSFPGAKKKLQNEREKKLIGIYSNLSAWQIVQVARHPQRPIFQDYLGKNGIIKDFREHHGDRCSGDDSAIITGLGKIIEDLGKGRTIEHKVMIIGQNKGRTTEEKVENHFGCPLPEGYRKTLQKMQFAVKYGIPIISFIDTLGAYPGIEAEERGVAQAIAQNLMQMSRLKTPMISIILGEGGSGGALGIMGQDNIAMLEYAYYSVASPEACAAILWRDKGYASDAAGALKITSSELKKLGLIDGIITEPFGGAHDDYGTTFSNVQNYIIKTLREVKEVPIEALMDQRDVKLRSIGNEHLVYRDQKE